MTWRAAADASSLQGQVILGGGAGVFARILVREADLEGDTPAALLMEALVGYLSQEAHPRDANFHTLARLLSMVDCEEGAQSPLECLFHPIAYAESYSFETHSWHPDDRLEPKAHLPWVKAFLNFQKDPRREQARSARLLEMKLAGLSEYPGHECLCSAILAAKYDDPYPEKRCSG